jgi:HemY protein
MLRLFPAFLVIALAVLAGVWLADHPGTVEIQWLGQRIEAPFWVLAVAVIAFGVGLAILDRLYRAVIALPRRLREHWRDRRRRQGEQAFDAAMTAVAAGEGAVAARLARRAGDLLGARPITRLLAAQAAQMSGDEDGAARQFQALAEEPGIGFLGLRGLIGQAVRRGDQAQALALAERAVAERPHSPWAVTTLFDLQARSGIWRDAALTLEIAVKRRIVAKDVAQKRRAALAFEQARTCAADDRGAEALALLRQAHRLDPDQAPIAAALVRRLAADGSAREAVKTALRAWPRAAHPLLAAAFRDIVPNELPIERAKRFERLARRAPDLAESHLALAEAALDASLWGEARSHLGKVIDAGGQASARAFRLMARVEESEKHDHAAASRWLGRAASAAADPAWICQSCGATTDEWHAVCPSCRGVDTLRWEQPRRASLPAPAA